MLFCGLAAHTGKTLGCHPNGLKSKPWASAHTDFGQGQVQHLGLPPKRPKVNTVGSPPTLAQRVLNETLWNPAFFLTARSARWLCFRYHRDSRKIPPLRGSLPSGCNPRKKTRGFPPLVRRYFGTGLRPLLHNLTCSVLFLKAKGGSEILLNGAASRPLARRPREGTAQRQDFQPVAVAPET